MPSTTILIDTSTRDMLRRVGRKEQTYDALIRELVAERLRNKSDGVDPRQDFD